MAADRTTLEVRMEIKGMTCAGCEEHVTKALEATGAKDVSVDFRHGEAHLRVLDDTDLKVLSRAVAQAGYETGEVGFVVSPNKVHSGKKSNDSLMAGPASPSTQRNGAAHGLGRDYDLVIIGSGGAAFSAAIQAKQHGARVAMIERETIGGTCVNVGCIPSKMLLRAGELYYQARNNPFAGLQTQALDVDMGLLVGQKDELVRALRREKYQDLINEYGFDLIRGEARFVDKSAVQVGDNILTGKAFLIATGASPLIPDIPGLRGVDFLTSTSALDLKSLPESLAVMGAGYIALELGQLYRHLGARVTLMQRSEQFLKSYEPEIGSAMARVLEKQGIEAITGVRYERVERTESGARIVILVRGEERVVEAEHLLVAVGRQPNTAALLLDRAGIKVGRRGEVVVDSRMRTTNPRVYAAGDVTMGPQFVYVAAYQGAVAADNALGMADREVALSVVPAVTFTNPAIASVGLGEAQARQEGYEVRASVLASEAVPRAQVNRETTGVFKLIADTATGRLLGAHVVAENAGDVIYTATFAIKFGHTIQDFKETLCPYLTTAEGLKLAALTFDVDVSKLSCCAG